MQVYSTSQSRWCCRLAPWSTLTDTSLGYTDPDGLVTLTISLDTDPCLSVMVVTRESLAENNTEALFAPQQKYRELKLPKNYRWGSLSTNLWPA